MKSKPIYPLQLDPDDYRRVKEAARQQERSAAYIIRQALKEWLERRTNREVGGGCGGGGGQRI